MQLQIVKTSADILLPCQIWMFCMNFRYEAHYVNCILWSVLRYVDLYYLKMFCNFDKTYRWECYLGFNKTITTQKTVNSQISDNAKITQCTAPTGTNKLFLQLLYQRTYTYKTSLVSKTSPIELYGIHFSWRIMMNVADVATLMLFICTGDWRACKTKVLLIKWNQEVFSKIRGSQVGMEESYVISFKIMCCRSL